MIRNRACKRTIAEWLSRVVQILLMPVLACHFLVDFRVREEGFFGLFSATSHRFRHAGGDSSPLDPSGLALLGVEFLLGLLGLAYQRAGVLRQSGTALPCDNPVIRRGPQETIVTFRRCSLTEI